MRDSEHPGSPPAVSTAADPADLAVLKNAISSLKAQVDHVLVSFHWGIPGRRELVDYQREVAYASIDAGASVILGHHAHVLQAVELYRKGIIFYGLSHFIFDLPGIISQLGFDTETAAVEVEFARDEVLGASIIPIVMEEGLGPRRADTKEADRILGLLADLSNPVGTQFSMDHKSGQIRVTR
jgi:poly-gamma-glutamate synthesis protein (capsule biosynthesis protein)